MKNILWVLLEKAFKLVMGVITSALIARLIGPAEFGVLNYAITLLTVLGVLASLGTNRIITRETVGKSIEEQIILLSTIFFIRLLIGFILIFLVYVFTLYQSDMLEKEIALLLVMSSIVFSAFDVFDMHRQAHGGFKIISLCRLSSFIVSNGFKIYLIITNKSLIYFAISVFLEYLITAILFIIFCGKLNEFKLIRMACFSYNKLVEILTESWVEILAGCCAILFMKMDVIMLQYMSTMEDVGVYTAASRISEAWYFIPATFVAVTFPRLVKLRLDNYSDYYESINLLNKILVNISFLLIIFFYLCGEEVIYFIYGSAFIESYYILLMHIFSSVFFVLGLTSGSWLVAEKKLKLNLYRNGFGLIINFILNYFFIKIYGIKGAALSTAISMASAYYFFDILHPFTRDMFLCKSKSLIPFAIDKNNLKGIMFLFSEKKYEN